jgi:NIMA-interacting peptidyl-prolyl cis-trans isomerase 4
MPPKGKGADKGGASKGKGKGKAEEKEEKGGKVKGAQQINVRHILVYHPRMRMTQWNSNKLQTEKHAKKEEALEKLKGGAKFDDVAKEFSEDKARAGKFRPIRDSGSFLLILQIQVAH